jgi:hypothetical protein
MGFVDDADVVPVDDNSERRGLFSTLSLVFKLQPLHSMHSQAFSILESFSSTSQPELGEKHSSTPNNFRIMSRAHGNDFLNVN